MALDSRAGLALLMAAALLIVVVVDTLPLQLRSAGLTALAGLLILGLALALIV